MVCAAGDRKLGAVRVPAPCPRCHCGVGQTGGAPLWPRAKLRVVLAAGPADALCSCSSPVLGSSSFRVLPMGTGSLLLERRFPNSAVRSYQRRCPAHPELAWHLLLFCAFYRPAKCNPAIFTLPGQSGKAIHIIVT